MMAVIIVNVGFMTLIWYGQPRMVGIVEQYANYVFTAIFTVWIGRTFHHHIIMY